MYLHLSHGEKKKSRQCESFLAEILLSKHKSLNVCANLFPEFISGVLKDFRIDSCFLAEGSPVHFRILAGIPSLHPLDVSSMI